MQRRILSGRPAPTKPFFRSGFWEGAEYRLYFDGGAQPEQDSLREKGRVRIWRFKNNPGERRHCSRLIT